MMRFEQRKQDYFNALERLREALKEAEQISSIGHMLTD